MMGKYIFSTLVLLAIVIGAVKIGYAFQHNNPITVDLEYVPDIYDGPEGLPLNMITYPMGEGIPVWVDKEGYGYYTPFYSPVGYDYIYEEGEMLAEKTWVRIDLDGTYGDIIQCKELPEVELVTNTQSLYGFENICQFSPAPWLTSDAVDIHQQ